MGLPYVQLETDFIKRKAATIAAILRTKRQTVIGMACDLFDYVVAETSSDTKPPDGIILDPDAHAILEGAMEWDGEPGKAFDAFMRAGVIEKLEVGARVRGCERYRATWEKNKRRKPDGNRTVTGEKPDGTGPEMESKRKREMKLPPSEVVVAPPPKVKSFEAGKVEKPTAPRESWTSSDFQRWCQYLRQQDGYPPEEPVPIGHVEAWWRKAMGWSDMQVQPICDAFVKFGQDPYWEKRHFPFKAFMSQWEKFARKEHRHVAV